MKNIALVSINKNKYSETFIHLQLKELPFNIHYLTGGYLPDRYSLGMEGADQLFIPEKNNLWARFLRTPVPERRKRINLQNAITTYLKQQNISVILAQYGHSGVEMLSASRLAKIPLIVHFHGFDAYRQEVLEEYGAQYPDMFAQASAIIAVSTDMKQQLIKLGAPENKIHLIPYGIDFELFSNNDSKRRNQPPKFVFCGRFVEKKAPFNLLLAFKKVLDQVPEAQFELIGDGHLREASEMLVNSLSMNNNVRFLGILDPEKVSATLAKSDIFVQHSMTTPSGDSEGSPLSTMEAGAAALPVIATRHKGIQEIVQDGVTGLLSDEGDIESMAQNMIQLAQNPEIMEKMGQAARQRIKEHYSRDRYIRELTKLIEKYC